jgi:predicted pyridoxine 5'-phosphate oxidase superfamily flavin-nucleotide-binding protein
VEDVAVAILTEEMKQFVREQRLGFIATVCPDNTPNLSPKGTLTVWDNEHLVFADIRSPGTIGNLRLNRSV